MKRPRMLQGRLPGRRGRTPGAALALAALIAAVGVASCQRQTTSAPAPLGAQTLSNEASYLAPPRVLSVRGSPDGTLAVSGSAPLRSIVEIVSPEGEQAHAVTDGRGRWTLRLAGASTPRLYAISAELAGRTVHAEGALITAPGAVTPAVTVRAGYAASPLGSSRATAIASVDYDPSGFIAVAGSAPAHAQLALVVDGAPAAVGQAEVDGRYALLAANRRLSMGPHQLQVRSQGGGAVRQVTLEPPVALAAPYQAWPGPDGWRVEWALNGGGVQTTLILAR